MRGVGASIVGLRLDETLYQPFEGLINTIAECLSDSRLYFLVEDTTAAEFACPLLSITGGENPKMLLRCARIESIYDLLGSHHAFCA